MAARSENMKGFYRQRKKSGVTKKPLQPSSSSNKSPKHSPTFGSDVTHAPALLSHGSPDLKGLLSPSLLIIVVGLYLDCRVLSYALFVRVSSNAIAVFGFKIILCNQDSESLMES